MFDAWFRKSKGPDQPLARWLYGGAPAGKAAQPDSAGVFPESVAQPTHEFELCLYKGGEVNYVSMDELPFAYKVLE